MSTSVTRGVGRGIDTQIAYLQKLSARLASAEYPHEVTAVAEEMSMEAERLRSGSIVLRAEAGRLMKSHLSESIVTLEIAR